MVPRHDITTDNEKVFEDHFCHQLDVKGQYRVRWDSKIDIDKELCLYFNDFEEFLQNTQEERLLELKTQLGSAWEKRFAEQFRQDLQKKRLFQILKEGISINEIHLELVYFPPERKSNTQQLALSKQNRFTAVRQYHFGRDSQRESFDIALLVNGFVIVTIELKNQGTSGDYTEAIKQYLNRDLSLPVFQQPFLHIVCDNETVKMAAAFSKPPDESDFRDFNKELVNIKPNDREYPVHYLYHDILLPGQLLDYMENYLYPGKDNKWIFPRYHQQRATRKVVNDLKEKVSKTGTLDLRYLIQHSTGSGKSNTIIWMVQKLRNAYVGDEKLFDSIIVLTDRINLDTQISKDFRKAILAEGVAEYAESTSDLKEALKANKKVIVSTIHKFSYLKDLADQSGKRICFLIDEAHRSQEGSLHNNLTDTFSSNKEGIEPTPQDEQEKLLGEIARKQFPNMAFITLTATPSDKTLQHFGKKVENEDGKTKYEPHDVYSMDQAIAENYILDVAKHIYSYDTLYKLDKEVDTKKGYLPMMIRKALRQKAYEDTDIIKEKCKMMLQVFKIESAHKIKGRAKAMIVSSSRLAAVKYKLFLDEEIINQGLKYKTLVAFSGNIDYEGNVYTEDSMNRPNNPQNEKIEDVFENNDNIRFLIVANKFQTGFDEPLLHTMFVDKPLRGRNAVQTLSRLNRKHPDKKDTLVVDYTGSYDEIMKAYRKYQKNVTTVKETNPKVLFELKDALLKFAVFTESDVEKVAELGRAVNPANMPEIAGIIYRIKNNYEALTDEKRKDEFRTLMNRYLSIFNYIKILYVIPQKGLWDFQTFLIYLANKLTNSDFNSLMKDIEDVSVSNYVIPKVDQTFEEGEEGSGTGGGGGSSITKVKQVKTVKEVIDEINQRFRSLITADGVTIVGEFFENVTRDESLKAIIISNKNKNPETVYDQIIKDQLNTKLIEMIITSNPELYEKMTSPDVMPYINRQAYNILRGAVLAA
jgi:type I restriction enzyme R subunit